MDTSSSKVGGCGDGLGLVATRNSGKDRKQDMTRAYTSNQRVSSYAQLPEFSHIYPVSNTPDIVLTNAAFDVVTDTGSKSVTHLRKFERN